MRTAEQTLSDVRDHFNVQSGDSELDAAVAALSGPPPLAEEDLASWFVDAVVQQPPEDLLRRVVVSADEVFAAVRELTDWRFDEVVSPCVEWCLEQVREASPRSVSIFGSTHYGLPLPSSDFDVCLVLQVGRNIRER